MSLVNDRRRLVYICDWLPPDFGAVGQYSVLFARELAAEGYDVTLAGLSTFGNSDHIETLGLGRYREIKLAAASYDKSSTVRRLFWTARTNTRLIFHLWNHLRAADTILFTGSPPLFLHWIAPANFVLKKELVYRITDFHPECAIAHRYFHPDHSATSQMLSGLTFALAERGRRVRIIASRNMRRSVSAGLSTAGWTMA